MPAPVVVKFATAGAKEVAAVFDTLQKKIDDFSRAQVASATRAAPCRRRWQPRWRVKCPASIFASISTSGGSAMVSLRSAFRSIFFIRPCVRICCSGA